MFYDTHHIRVVCQQCVFHERWNFCTSVHMCYCCIYVQYHLSAEHLHLWTSHDPHYVTDLIQNWLTHHHLLPLHQLLYHSSHYYVTNWMKHLCDQVLVHSGHWRTSLCLLVLCTRRSEMLCSMSEVIKSEKDYSISYVKWKILFLKCKGTQLPQA